MKFMVSDAAQKWYQDNLELEKGDGLHFYGKVYGKTNVHDGFSLAFIKEKPHNPYYVKQIDGINYFFSDNDIWFFSGYDLQIDYDPAIDSPKYTFIEED
ncbi:HesB/YadR/YfhF family protein [Bombilactobacillus thymidiniphilus]|uniref:Iron-sulfur cluster biosynthesis protein n=1 Tax=Bombilactobacillus thymidiniphilus TaxID=2923363 RepID=A0ABY4PCK3_9LACO|nr:iron-sulfur cluster biosynthesis protein [Bombilactobacillus thymidiniphilus]UQS83384.1 iron-sulfur cluster biosynthesis protein [Bombilactobacillus thymidiniphilus]